MALIGGIQDVALTVVTCKKTIVNFTARMSQVFETILLRHPLAERCPLTKQLGRNISEHVQWTRYLGSMLWANHAAVDDGALSARARQPYAGVWRVWIGLDMLCT